MNYFKKIIFVLMILSSYAYSSKKDLTIGIIKDASTPEFNNFNYQLQKEITNLLDMDYNVNFKEFTSNMDTSFTKKYIQQMMDDSTINYVVSLGYISSNIISKLPTYSKPVIATTILDEKLQKLPKTKDNTTDINNFTYLESIIDLRSNLKNFANIFNAKNIAILIPESFKSNYPQLNSFLDNKNSKLTISLITISDTVNVALNQIDSTTDAVIVLPMVNLSQTQIKQIFDELNQKKLPSLAVSGINYLNLGATITMTPELTFQQISRQVALRVLKLNEGVNPSLISTNIEKKNVSIINMESLRSTEKFPKWNILNESILINVTNFSKGKNLNLRLAISEALENNLQGKMSSKDVEIADREVRIAKGNILPQVSIGGSAVALSENIVESAMGQRGEFTLSGTASLKQVLYSESVFANIAINKLMLEGKKFYNKQTILDVVYKTSTAYIGLLFSKSNLLIQNENVNTTKKNLEMAKVKEEVGETGLSDVNRWISELNMNKMKFNDSYTTYRSSMYNINQILNSEISGAINIIDSNSINKTIFSNKDLLKTIFENPILTEKYATFVINEMKKNSPELQQLDAMADILKRQNSLYKKQWFMPELVAFGGLDQAFIRDGVIKPDNMPVPDPPDDLTYNYGIQVQIPIFQGGKSSAKAKKALMELDKVNFQKTEVSNKLESLIRSNIQKLRASYLELELSKNAAKAGEANFKIVQSLYFQGAADLIKLIDAQNVMVQTRFMVNISYYQYTLDYLAVERYQGSFNFLKNQKERNEYTNRLKTFLQTNQKENKL